MLNVAVALALFAAATPYDDVRGKAVAVDRLASTVAALVGVCPDGLMVDELEECKKNLGTAAKQWAGKTVVVSVGAVDPQFMSFASRDAETAKLVWAPLLDLGNELALTLGKPDKLSPSGTIVVARKPFSGPSDGALLDSDLQRAAKTGNIAVEMVGTFGKPWQLQGGGRIVRGLSFEPTAIRFIHARTGKVLVEVTNLK
jgi:hypothetical protein